MTGPIPLHRFTSLSRHPSIEHFISTRHGGVSSPPYESLNLGLHVGDAASCVITNREKLFTSVGIPLSQVVIPLQTHGNNVAVIKENQGGNGAYSRDTAIADTDALITDKPNLCLAILVADCVPLLMYDPVRNAIAAVHAGRLGLQREIIIRTIRKMHDEFGSNPADIWVGIGPSISPEQYEIGETEVHVTKQALPYADQIIGQSPSGNPTFNLWKTTNIQLEIAGVVLNHIEHMQICTRTHCDTFFSDRSQRPTGRFAACIMIVRS